MITDIIDNYIWSYMIFDINRALESNGQIKCSNMIAWSNGKIFRVIGPLWGEFDVPLICAQTNSWENHRDAGDLRRHRTHYDVTVINGITPPISCSDLVFDNANTLYLHQAESVISLCMKRKRIEKDTRPLECEWYSLGRKTANVPFIQSSYRHLSKLSMS